MAATRYRLLCAAAIALAVIAVPLIASNDSSADPPTIIDSGITGDVEWSLDSDGLLSITGNGEMADYSSGFANPWYTYGLTDIFSINVGEGVTHVGNFAFQYCQVAATATLPDGLISIGDRSFEQCQKLLTINLPESLTSIGKAAFNGCIKLESAIVIPDGITSLPDTVFNGCASIKSITLPEGLTTIGFNTFGNCKSLQSITLPEGLTSIGGSAFSGCSALQSITLPEGLTSIEANTFSFCATLTSLNIPDGVTSIGSGAFASCFKLESLNIPDGVTSIGVSAFEYCESLKKISIPEGVTAIDSYTFSNCISLQSITLPEGLTVIGSYVFRNCISMTEISIPEGVKNIQFETLSGCVSLKKLSLSDNTLLSGTSFATCANLDTLRITASGSPNSIISTYFPESHSSASTTPWQLSGMPMTRPIINLIIDTENPIDLSDLAIIEGKTLTITAQSINTSGGMYYDTDGVAELLGEDIAGKKYIATDIEGTLSWVAVDEPMQEQEQTGLWYKGSVEIFAGYSLPVWAVIVLIICCFAALSVIWKIAT